MLLALQLMQIRLHSVDTIRCNDVADRFRRYAELREIYRDDKRLFVDVYADGSIRVYHAHDPHKA